jgi:hypothetical protein
MKAERITLALTYAMILLVIIGTAMAGWHRASDTMWLRMPDVRWKYDALGAVVVVFAVVVATGLWLRREWGRLFAISLCWIVFFMFLGIRLIAPFMIGLDLASFIDVESIAMGVLATVNMIGLNNRSFRDNYSANSSLNADARKKSAPAG